VLAVVLTDGRANVPLPNVPGGAWEQALDAAAALAAADVSTLVLDTETDFIRHGRAKTLAQILAAEYLPLEELTAESLPLEVRRRVTVPNPAWEKSLATS